MTRICRRLLSYGDAQRYRLGVNHHQITISQLSPQWAMRTDGSLEGTPTYWPNSLGEWTDQPELNKPPLEITGVATYRDHRVDDVSRGAVLEDEPSAEQRLFENTAGQLGQASKQIQERHVANCARADPDYGNGVADALVRFAAGQL